MLYGPAGRRAAAMHTLPSPAATAGSLFYAVSRHVEERAEERVHPVFLLDEAHLLHQDTLEHLRRAGERIRKDRRDLLRTIYPPEQPGVRDW